jgi:hypothetical protein
MEALFAPLDHLDDQNAAFTAGTFLRLISRAQDCDSATFMFGISRSDKIIPVILSHLAYPVVWQSIHDWITGRHPELAQLIWYMFRQLFPSDFEFRGQSEVREFNSVLKEFCVDWDFGSPVTASATREVVFELICQFFIETMTVGDRFGAFVLQHLADLRDSQSFQGSWPLYRLAVLLGSTERLCRQATELIQNADSLASADAIAVLQYLEICADCMGPSDVQCLVRKLLTADDVPQLALKVSVTLVHDSLANGNWDPAQFNGEMFNIVRTCWNQRASHF